MLLKILCCLGTFFIASCAKAQEDLWPFESIKNSVLKQQPHELASSFFVVRTLPTVVSILVNSAVVSNQLGYKNLPKPSYPPSLLNNFRDRFSSLGMKSFQAFLNFTSTAVAYTYTDIANHPLLGTAFFTSLSYFLSPPY
ncbi:MAG TPA: hypothetical protein VI959_02815 [Alphaproteobacteria bacterium]|nr:hypothetical protein [Alphaproteobacteria bacterium]